MEMSQKVPRSWSPAYLQGSDERHGADRLTGTSSCWRCTPPSQCRCWSSRSRCSAAHGWLPLGTEMPAERVIALNVSRWGQQGTGAKDTWLLPGPSR